MKFAKTLQEELLQEWQEHYINYKSLKKVLKLDQVEAVPAFCNLLDSEICKVQRFLLQQQEGLWKALAAINVEVPGKNSSGTLRNVNASCESVVSTIQQLQSYVALNHTAVQKIIKKFDKRFHVVPAPVKSHVVINANSIGTWLLAPAQQCLRLVRTFAGNTAPLERPLRQFNFWMQELRAGAMVAKSQTAGEMWKATNLRLQLTCGKDIECRIRNTFIDVTQRDQHPRQRSRSLPARLPHEAFKPGQRHCMALAVEPAQHRAPHAVPEIDDSQSRDTSFDTSPVDSPSWPALWETKQGGDAAEPAKAADEVHEPWPAQLREGDTWDTKVSYSHSRTASSSRWWTDSPEACPICGFPIRLLPYPPFKLQASSYDAREPAKLVDGPFMVLKVLSTWNFEVLGHVLTISDIKALDTYMKRCKLGPFRLGRALELYDDSSKEAREELDSLRTRARRRLEGLKHIQQVRMNKLDFHGEGEGGDCRTNFASKAQAQSSRQIARRRQWGRPRKTEPAVPGRPCTTDGCERSSHGRFL